MKLSTRARYALRMMLEIAKRSGSDAPVSLSQIAESGNMSRRYLEQLAIDLKEASLIRGFAGKKGGYLLALPQAEIKIGSIVEASIGRVNIVDCVLDPDTCLKSDICECRVVYQLINRKIVEVLNEFSLAELADGNWLKKMRNEIGISSVEPATDKKKPKKSQKDSKHGC
jgi:Rrf2 family protein